MSINILHVDDEQEVSIYLDELCQEREEDVFVHWFETFDKGIKALKEKPFFYSGVILDAKCLINVEDGVFDEKNVIKAIFQLESIFRAYQNWLPYCILSGYKENLSREIELFDLSAWDKNAQEADAIDQIVKEQTKVHRFNLEKKYPGIIEMAEEDLLLAHNISTIVQLYSANKLGTENRAIIKAQISQIRPLLERIVIKLSERGYFDGELLIPEGGVQKINSGEKARYLTECFKYLSGVPISSISDDDKMIQRKAIMPSYISWQCTCLYQVASDIANHTNKNTGSKYTLDAMFNSLIDILYWYKDFMNKI